MNTPAPCAPAPAVFRFDSLNVRVVDRAGEPWFIAADVCAALEIKNPSDALARLDADEQALVSNEGIHRGSAPVNVINESGLYSLILGSRKPSAKRFKKWVTSEVLPAIRKTGRYEVGTTPALPSNSQFHSDTYGRLAEASCRFDVAQELAERTGMNADGCSEPADTVCTDVWAISYLIESGKALVDEAAAVLFPLTMPRSGPPTPAVEPAQPAAPLAVCERDPVSPSPAPLAVKSAERTWIDPEHAEALLRSMRFSIREVYNLSLKSPDQVEQMHRLGVIGERQFTKLRRLMA